MFTLSDGVSGVKLQRDAKTATNLRTAATGYRMEGTRAGLRWQNRLVCPSTHYVFEVKLHTVFLPHPDQANYWEWIYMPTTTGFVHLIEGK